MSRVVWGSQLLEYLQLWHSKIKDIDLNLEDNRGWTALEVAAFFVGRTVSQTDENWDIYLY